MTEDQLAVIDALFEQVPELGERAMLLGTLVTAVMLSWPADFQDRWIAFLISQLTALSPKKEN